MHLAFEKLSWVEQPFFLKLGDQTDFKSIAGQMHYYRHLYIENLQFRFITKSELVSICKPGNK